MKQFKCEIERIDKYEVEFDTETINEEWLSDFRNYFYDFFTLEDHAKHITQHRARFGRKFIEGYGVPLENGEVPYWANKEEVNHGININVISEDDESYINFY